MEPPYEFITLKTGVEVEDPELDDLGSEFNERCRAACRALGYSYRYRSGSSDPDHETTLIVKGELEQTSRYQDEEQAERDRFSSFLKMVNEED